MKTALAERWWAMALRGLVYLLFGLMALLWPGLTFGTLLLLFGIFTVLDGGLSVAGAVRAGRRRERWLGLALEGVVSLLVGLAVLFWPDVSALALLYVIGAWAALTGGLEVLAAVRLRREIEGEWLLAANGVLSLLFGIAVFLWPAAGALAIVWLLGVYALLFAALLFGLSWRMRRHARRVGQPRTA